MKDKICEMSEIFRILSNEVRLCIVINLCLNGEKRVGELQDCSNSSQSFVSQQLSKLKALGIITSRKSGTEVYYSMNNEEIRKIVGNIDFKNEQINK